MPFNSNSKHFNYNLTYVLGQGLTKFLLSRSHLEVLVARKMT